MTTSKPKHRPARAGRGLFRSISDQFTSTRVPALRVPGPVEPTPSGWPALRGAVVRRLVPGWATSRGDALTIRPDRTDTA